MTVMKDFERERVPTAEHHERGVTTRSLERLVLIHGPSKRLQVLDGESETA